MKAFLGIMDLTTILDVTGKVLTRLYLLKSVPLWVGCGTTRAAFLHVQSVAVPLTRAE